LGDADFVVDDLFDFAVGEFLDGGFVGGVVVRGGGFEFRGTGVDEFVDGRDADALA